MVLNGNSVSCSNKGDKSTLPRRDAGNLILFLMGSGTFLWMNSVTISAFPLALSFVPMFSFLSLLSFL